MFRKNNFHFSPELYNVYNTANNTRKKILENHWSDTFYTKIFSGITEDIFEPLYCENNGRPNFPVNILAGLEILKSLFELTDEELYENYHFNVLYQRALGAENINDYSFSIRTLYNGSSS
jgi:lysine/ornithine N-monooxygenase